VTHAGDYAIDDTPPYVGLCNECVAGGKDLRHAPCPPSAGAADKSEPFVYAARAMHFGKPADWKGPNADAFRLGYDLDCSDRPQGTPVLCKPRPLEGPNAVPWQPMPHGIDNTLVQRIFTPLYEQAEAFGMAFDVDATYSANMEQGRNGIVVIVDHWNGAGDDPAVFVNVYSSPGLSEDNGPPRWDGTDTWDNYTTEGGLDTKYFKVDRAEGYVAGGVLVADYRKRGDVSLRFGTLEASFRLFVHDLFLVGAITPDRIDYLTLTAVADLATTLDAVPDLARVLGACNEQAEAYLNVVLVDLLTGAADMPSSSGKPADSLCDAISFSWAFDAQKAKIGGERADSPVVDGGCL
jgi:hypothetical protein